MSFNPLTEKGIPLDRQLRSWSELNVQPYNKKKVDPYTRTRIKQLWEFHLNMELEHLRLACEMLLKYEDSERRRRTQRRSDRTAYSANGQRLSF